MQVALDYFALFADRSHLNADEGIAEAVGVGWHQLPGRDDAHPHTPTAVLALPILQQFDAVWRILDLGVNGGNGEAKRNLYAVAHIVAGGAGGHSVNLERFSSPATN